MSAVRYRRGPDHRQIVAQPDFGSIHSLFGFRSVVIGRWVTTEERQHAAGWFFDALMDLLHILAGPAQRYGLPSSLIALRGSLALKYGSGGRPGVAAHYEPATRTFALAKNAGPGSLAHEWFHAFDHYIASRMYPSSGPAFASACFYQQQVPISEHTLVDAWQHCMAQIFAPDSELVAASLAYDQAQGCHYYRQPEEIAARAFEAFVQDATIKNAWLVSGSRASAEAKAGVYPQGEQRQRITTAFSEYFSQLSLVLLRNGE
jgi:hypothetical protein